MSIETRIQAINDHLVDDYKVLRLAGADLTGVNKNIVNLKMSWKERLLYFINNGTDEVWNNWDKVNGTGTTLSLNNTEEAPMSLTYKGNTSQSGTPTPSSPIPVQVVSGDNSIVVSNGTQSTSYPVSLGVENLLNSNINKTTINGITFTPVYNDDSTLKYIIANGTASANVYFTLGNVNVKANTSYLLSGCPANDGSNAYRLYAYMYDSNNTYLNVAIDYGYGNGTTFSNASLDHIQVGFTITSGKTVNNFKIYLMVELGTTKHSYTPYGVQPIELCKIGTYQDKIFKNTPNTTDYDSNLEDNVWYLKKEIGKVRLSGNWNWNVSNTGTEKYIYYAYPSPSIPVKTGTSGICTHYPYTSIGNDTNQGIFWASTFFRVRYGTEEPIADYKTWLNNNNVLFYYVLATPTYETITDTTLLSQLEALKKSYESVTNISQVNNDMPFELNITALSNE